MCGILVFRSVGQGEFELIVQSQCQSNLFWLATLAKPLIADLGDAPPIHSPHRKRRG